MGQPISVAIEDIQNSIVDDSFAEHIRKLNDQLDNCVDQLFNEATEGAPSASTGVYQPLSHDDFDGHSPADVDTLGPGDTTSDILSLSSASERKERLWPLDNKFYPATVVETNSDGQFFANYEDGNVETLDLSPEPWRLCNVVSSVPAGFPSLWSNSSHILKAMLE